ncbi:ABC transporter permease [Croceibacterium sp. LX-88]|jgi:putative ABC transport system permease protein|uniref:ABC transporter permease n=1 Tax=Croceibacterium selenioxidans TaxID=2838833 RepID=A0ABS5W150_9SPHN|nr:ABC transporter permease [Croceibacterium selenioxidans]MBT2133042.1 ABC transporter permease [Croceibacterium selenioxidans]
MFGTTLLLAFREIRRHILRSFLTTLGIIIGVGAVITMVTLGKGVTADIEEQISSLGSNVFFVFPIQTDRGQIRPFDERDVQAVREQVAGVNFVAGQVERNVSAIHNGQDWQTKVEGVGNEFLDARGIEIEEGRRFTAAEQTAGANVCIIGPTVRDEIFLANQSPVGERMRLNDVSCQVIGVFATRGSVGGGGDDDNSIFMPLTNVQRRFTGDDNIGYMVVAYDASYDSKTMINAIVKLMRERRVLLEGQQNDFDIVDTAQINETVAATVGTMTVMVAAIAAISLIVGGVGIMNIMLVSVTERTREIGIRLAIGALAREVQLQFLTEAVVLCCFGGIVGILLGFALSFGLSTALGIAYVFDPFINVLSFVISALIGIIFGYFPARRASKLDPIEALRHE